MVEILRRASLTQKQPLLPFFNPKKKNHFRRFVTMSNMPTTTSVLSAYTAFAASAMLVRSILSELRSMTTQLIPQTLQEKIALKLRFLFDKSSFEITLTIDEHFNGLSSNEVYEAAAFYLETKISPSNKKLMVTKAQGDTELSISVDKGEEIIDFFKGVRVIWRMICTESQKTSFEYEGSMSSEKVEHKSFELSFLQKHNDLVLRSYLPYLMDFAKSKKEEKKVVKLGSLGNGHYGMINLNHPSTFATLAIDPIVKQTIIDDLDRFVERQEYYKRVGKAWKRGYLLYGPPGTGKSSLIAAIANYLKFNVYDVELTSFHDNASLRNLLVHTENRSIIVIEDIDCSVDFQNRQSGRQDGGGKGLSLSGLLNFIDGLWSGCGDERIIIFTTNYKDKLDPALLRPGRMDVHIHMSYLTPSGFRVLASNYLGLTNHPSFGQIDDLLTRLEVTPAVVAEELMKTDDPKTAIEGLLKHLQGMKSDQKESSEPDKELKRALKVE